ncbi:MAG: hypothetical protein IPK72_19005 [Candidatus Eisenbacteria bacterium]|nr:hypothetical protein [Candidatus Eisenbacteria bacterium]
MMATSRRRGALRVGLTFALLCVVWIVPGASADQLLLHADGSWEDGYAWIGFQAPEPGFGSFAECYAGEYDVVAVRLSITGDGLQDPPFADVFVWADDGAGRPGQVLRVTPNFYLPPPPYPDFWNAEVPMGPGCCVSGNWWVGFRGLWIAGQLGFYIGADLNGPNQGCPMTNIAPGLGYPEGWQDVAVRWEPTQALGIGAIVGPCAPVAVAGRTWGAVKALYR